MKKLVLLFTTLLIGLTSVTAAEKMDIIPGEKVNGKDLLTNRYRFNQPIQFIERGVEFLIFPDGSFDFNTHVRGNNSNHNHDDGYYRNSNTQRRSVNATYGAPRTHVTYSSPRNRGVIITHDRDGKVRRIGNVFVNYNRYDQVRRLGSVYMRYNRRGLLSQVGNLNIEYNRHGFINNVWGFINHRNFDCAFCSEAACIVDHYGNDNHWNTTHDNDWDNWNDQSHNDDDFYYYKKNGKVEKHKKLKKKETS